MRRTLAVVCALVVMLGGCAGGDDPGKPTRTFEPQRTASSPSPKAVAKDSIACGLLTAKERRSIAGQRLATVDPVAAPAEDTHQCRWSRSLSTPSSAYVKVVAQRAQVWAGTVPAQIDSAIASGRASAKFSKRLLAAKKKVLEGVDKISDDEACEMFSLLVKVNEGKRSEGNRFLLYQGDNSGQLAASVHTCKQGVYTAVTYGEPGLIPSVPLSEAILRLGDTAHRRAVERL